MTMIDAVYENGVFRPLGPVALAEHTAVKIPVPAEPASYHFEPHAAQPYPDEESEFAEGDLDYVSVPPQRTYQLKVKACKFEWAEPLPYPDGD